MAHLRTDPVVSLPLPHNVEALCATENFLWVFCGTTQGRIHKFDFFAALHGAGSSSNVTVPCAGYARPSGSSLSKARTSMTHAKSKGPTPRPPPNSVTYEDTQIPRSSPRSSGYRAERSGSWELAAVPSGHRRSPCHAVWSHSNGCTARRAMGPLWPRGSRCDTGHWKEVHVALGLMILRATSEGHYFIT